MTDEQGYWFAIGFFILIFMVAVIWFDQRIDYLEALANCRLSDGSFC